MFKQNYQLKVFHFLKGSIFETLKIKVQKSKNYFLLRNL